MSRTVVITLLWTEARAYHHIYNSKFEESAFWMQPMRQSLSKILILVRHQKRVYFSKDTMSTPKTSTSFMTAVITVRRWPKIAWRPWWAHLWDWPWIRPDHLQEDVSFPAWSQTQGTQANARQRYACWIKCECRDSWTSRGALDSIPFHCPCFKTQETMNDASTKTDGSSHQRTMRVIKTSEGQRERVLKGSRRTFEMHSPLWWCMWCNNDEESMF